MNESFKNLIFYEIYPNSFKDSNGDGYGDFKGIISKLDYIQHLGCNAIWLNPHFDSPFKDGGYDVSDFYHASSRFGTDEEFFQMVDEIHQRGMKLIIDLVAGHTSEENPIFIKSASPYPSEYDDMFIWTNNPWMTPSEYRFLNGRFDRNGTYMVNFFQTQPALNYGWKNIRYPEWQMSYKDPRTFKTRDYIIDVCKYYLSKGVDGFRVDMADSLVKDDPDKSATIEVWYYIFDRVRKDYPNAYFVAEWGDPEKAIKAGFDTCFFLNNNLFYNDLARREELGRHDESFLKLHSTLNIQDDFKDYERIVNVTKDLGYTNFISCNHDTPRPTRFLKGKELRLFYMMLFTLPGIPYLYYGDEIAMRYQENLPSKECGFGRTGTRTPMPWDESKNQGFSSCEEKDLFLPMDQETSVTKCEKDPDSIYYFIQKLIQLRLHYPSLQGNEFKIVNDGTNHYISYRRNDLFVVINPSDKELKLDVKGTILFQDGDVSINQKLVVASQSSAVIQL